MEGKDFCCYEFGEFQLDERRRSLSKNGERIPLSARNFDLLLFLVENGGRVLEHNEILDKVWVDTFVEQASLKKGISALRHILEDNSETEFIKTIPRRGYSFIVPVRIIREGKEILFLRETQQEIIFEEMEDDGVVETSNSLSPLSSAQNENLLGAIKKHRIAVIAASIFLISLLGYGVWTLKGKNVRGLSVENIAIVRLTSLGNLSNAIISPSGDYLIYVGHGVEGVAVWIQQPSTRSATQITPKIKGSIWSCSFSPDENYVYYTVDNHSNPAQNGLFKVPLFGGAPQKVAENIGFPFSFSPDGRRLTFTRRIDGRFRVFTANADFTGEKLIAELDDVDFRIWGMNWSPDSQSLMLALRKTTADKIVHYVAEYPVDGGKEKIVVPEMDKQITSALWLPDKSSLLVCLRELNAEVRQIWQYFPASGEFRRVTNDDNSYKNLSITHDGKSIATITDNRYAAVWTADNEKFDFKQVTTGISRIDKVSWTGDGRLIYSAVENGFERISIMNTDGTQSRHITGGKDGIWLLPKISGDGSFVTYSSLRGGQKRLYRIDFDGRNPTQLTPPDYNVREGKLLSDNRTIVFDGISKTANREGLFKQTADGAVKPLTDGGIDEWDVSPDEKFLAYAAMDVQTKKPRIFIKFLENGSIFKSFEITPFWNLCWTKDGKALTYTSPDRASEIFLQPIAGGEPKIVAKFPEERIFSLDWSFDGKKLAVVRGRQLSDAVLIKIGEQQ